MTAVTIAACIFVVALLIALAAATLMVLGFLVLVDWAVAAAAYARPQYLRSAYDRLVLRR